MRAGPWTKLRGDGTDPVPPVWTKYEARLRNGQLWTELAITPFCIGLGAHLFRHSGVALDPIAIRIIASVDHVAGRG
ncbi:hypothetical protein K9B35_14430 [Sphingomonas sp. R647]|uniref:hypothetical protein n=1 Tax=Sphingomonas sp. R647 TaxID=2875233 RepID=UPI001CD81037|nr:hypothetical protein [Sphingomonas sp. R647]MCA1199171.1 hypothetical protein [Sphingomonas sp. R647]